MEWTGSASESYAEQGQIPQASHLIKQGCDLRTRNPMAFSVIIILSESTSIRMMVGSAPNVLA
jgi:hypothetical protein